MASCFRGAFPPVDLRAVCLVLAIAKSASVKEVAVHKQARYLKVYNLDQPPDDVYLLVAADWCSTPGFWWRLKISTSTKPFSYFTSVFAIIHLQKFVQYIGMMYKIYNHIQQLQAVLAAFFIYTFVNIFIYRQSMPYAIKP